LLIFAIGLLLNASPFVRWDAAGELVPKSWDTLRMMGVLQRIALCFGAAAAIVWLFGRRGALIAAGALLLGYWAACERLGAPGDAYSLQGWFGTALDHALLGESHLYRGEGLPFDPEGLASTPPAIAQVLLGWWVGDRVRRGPVDAAPAAPAGAVGPGPGAAGRPVAPGQMPINKKIWTSSYVLLTTGLAMGAGAVHGLIEIRRRPLEMAGLGAFLRGLRAQSAVHLRAQRPGAACAGPVALASGCRRTGPGAVDQPAALGLSAVFAGIGSDPRLGSLLFALANLALYARWPWWLDRRRIYIRV
jgi:predicted acyltransferase